MTVWETAWVFIFLGALNFGLLGIRAQVSIYHVCWIQVRVWSQKRTIHLFHFVADIQAASNFDLKNLPWNLTVEFLPCDRDKKVKIVQQRMRYLPRTSKHWMSHMSCYRLLHAASSFDLKNLSLKLTVGFLPWFSDKELTTVQQRLQYLLRTS